MAASCFSMATTQVHLPSLEATASSSCIKAPSARVAMMAMPKLASYSLELSHVCSGISCRASPFSRRRFPRITALAQEAPLAAEVIEPEEQVLDVPDVSEEQLEVPEAIQEQGGEPEEVSEQEGEAEQDTYDQDLQPIPEGTKLYVGNLPFTIDSAGLAEIFEESGTVEMVEVIYDRTTGRSRGFAFVTMSTVEDAEAAIEKFDGSQIGGRTVKVNFPEVPRGAERSRQVAGPRAASDYGNFVDSLHKIYVGNLAWHVNAETLREVFNEKGNVLGAKVVFDRETGRSRGFGFITFDSQADVEAAVSALDGVELEGRPMRVSVAMSRPTEEQSNGSQMQNY